MEHFIGSIVLEGPKGPKSKKARANTRKLKEWGPANPSSKQNRPIKISKIPIESANFLTKKMEVLSKIFFDAFSFYTRDITNPIASLAGDVPSSEPKIGPATRGEMIEKIANLRNLLLRM